MDVNIHEYNVYMMNSVLMYVIMHRMEQVLTKANEAMGFTTFTAIARDLLCDDKERRFEAAEKYTRLTDCVTDRILESNEPSNSLRKVMIIIMHIHEYKTSLSACVYRWREEVDDIEALI